MGKPQAFIGIDPGLDGAVVVILANGDVKFYDAPTIQVGKRRDYNVAIMADIFRDLQVDRELNAIIESVHAMPKQGVVSTFTFGKGLGLWLGILAALQIPHELVTPQRWKKTMMDGMDKEKDSSRQKAIRMFPRFADSLKLKKHHGRADALLMAAYLRRTTSGNRLRA